MTNGAAPAVAQLILPDGHKIDQIGLGTWPLTDDEAAHAVAYALKSGYRLIDTAARYGNEVGVGQGIRDSGVNRQDVFLTSKLQNGEQGFDTTLRAFDASLERLGMDYLDLYLIHWPMPRQDRYVDTWRALVRLQGEGRLKSIGVSNFLPEHIDRIREATGVQPVVNQIEMHPEFSQEPLRAWHAAQGIILEAWSPLGRGSVLDHDVVRDLAQRHGRQPAQIILRWHIQRGVVAIPKSRTPQRIRQNLEVFDFTLSQADMTALGSIECGNRQGGDPLTWEQL